MALLRQLGRKIVAGIIMILVVASFNFFLVRLMPGNPATQYYNNLISTGVPYQIAMERTKIMYDFLPHQPLFQQYLNFLWQIVHFNLGRSITYEGVPVWHIIGTAAPWTLSLVPAGIIVSFIIGVAAGVVAAVFRNSWPGQSTTFVATLLHGIPAFMMAVLLAYLFTTYWPVLPFGAPYNAAIKPGLSAPFILSLAHHAALPIAAYAISGYGGWALSMKASVTTVLGQDFVLAAELRGLRRGTRLRYIARNAFLPLFTQLALQIGFMFSGAVFIETVFDYPGLGSLLNTSVGNHDYTLMDGTFLLLTATVIASNILADVTYAAIDPRIRR